MWWIVPVVFLLTLAALAIMAALSGPKHPKHAGRHLAVVRDDRGQVDGYGSMILAEEQATRLYWGAPLQVPQPEWNPALDWREQTAAELSPEALGAYRPDPGVLSDYPPTDPGPGVSGLSSLAAPGPDQPPPCLDPDWLAGQMADLFGWVRAQLAPS